ncbi:MAG: hypothetical protein KVP17_001967 [Porospora cf. gigantea B]|uniref:uncharacterized protein n=1 Tax=Porospora cf. gigantea B TaxID=2853592 RepID=UPI0035719C9F|nr:MAG: hypothetical protein KVP17_001967 [Porospora cf. gigantea B]
MATVPNFNVAPASDDAGLDRAKQANLLESLQTADIDVQKTNSTLDTAATSSTGQMLSVVATSRPQCHCGTHELWGLAEAKREFLAVLKSLRNWSSVDDAGAPIRLTDPSYRYHWNRVLQAKSQADLSCYFVLLYALDPMDSIEHLAAKVDHVDLVDLQCIISDLELFCLVNTTELERTNLLVASGDSIVTAVVALNHLLIHTSVNSANPSDMQRAIEADIAQVKCQEDGTVIKSDRAERLEKRNKNAAKKEGGTKRKSTSKDHPSKKRKVKEETDALSPNSTADTSEEKRSRNYNTRRKPEIAVEELAAAAQ